MILSTLLWNWPNNISVVLFCFVCLFFALSQKKKEQQRSTKNKNRTVEDDRGDAKANNRAAETAAKGRRRMTAHRVVWFG